MPNLTLVPPCSAVSLQSHFVYCLIYECIRDHHPTETSNNMVSQTLQELETPLKQEPLMTSQQRLLLLIITVARTLCTTIAPFRVANLFSNAKRLLPQQGLCRLRQVGRVKPMLRLQNFLYSFAHTLFLPLCVLRRLL